MPRQPTSTLSNFANAGYSATSYDRVANFCTLCEREVDSLTVHHLIPRQATKRKKLEASPTIDICSACHRQIHTLFSNADLARELNSLEKLKQEPQLQRFLSWVKKQDPNKRVKVNRKKL